MRGIMSFRWIRNVIIAEKKTDLEIQIGYYKFGDRCYTRIDNETETYFQNMYETREDILAQGIEILQERLTGKTITKPDGKPFKWK